MIYFLNLFSKTPGNVLNFNALKFKTSMVESEKQVVRQV